MKVHARIVARVINAARILFLLVLTGIYSLTVSAQTLQISNNYSIAKVSNAGKKIHHAAMLTMEAKARPFTARINSAYAELKPALAPDGQRLYFSRSGHPGNILGETDLEDIWYAELDTLSGNWSDPIRMSGHLNNMGPNFINSVSLTGDTIILGNQYLKKGKMRSGLSYSVNVRGQWSEAMPIKIKNDYNLSDHANAYVSLKSGVIISSIERDETVGGRDLYVSFWNGKEATQPINMEMVINTDQEEASPFLAEDNKTLYFASNGHSGYGGLDIFVTRRLDETWTNWSEPENLGPAINGNLDDSFFSITHGGEYAVFSKQTSVHNTDIFSIEMNKLFTNKSDDGKADIVKSNLSVAGLFR